VEAALVQAQFEASDLFAQAVEIRGDRGAGGTPDGLGASGPAAQQPAPALSPGELAQLVKDTARFLGADDAGVAPLDPAHLYSRRGRPLDQYGRDVDLAHESAVVMVFRMRHERIQAGPEMIATAETARVYQQAAAACFAMAEMLQRLGIPARAHVDSNYLLLCPPLAVAAGLGELGRNGVLIHPVFGPELRLGVVSVAADLAADAPGCWGIADFCRDCAKCAELCPSAAIPSRGTRVLRGAEKWPLDPERCYHHWRTLGTDCGICLRVCPFAKPDTPLHRLVRRIAARTRRLTKLFLWWDDRLYGRSSRPRRVLRLGPGTRDSLAGGDAP
jgi:ferredoxin